MTSSSACAASIDTPGFRRCDDLEGAGGAQRRNVRELPRQRPDLGWPRELHIAGDHADNGVRLAVQPHETADNRRIAAESTVPHGLAEQHHAR
jgi:hypothetical protein